MVAQMAKLQGEGEQLVSNTILSHHLEETKEQRLMAIADTTTRRLSCQRLTRTREQGRATQHPQEQTADDQHPTASHRKPRRLAAFFLDRAEKPLLMPGANLKNERRTGENVRFVGR